MTVKDIVTFVDRVYSNDIDMDVKAGFIAHCDAQLRRDLLPTHEQDMDCKAEEQHTEKDTGKYDGDTVLFAPDRYADLYRWYLQARLSLILSQAGMYQTCAALYESARDEFAKEYNRTHMPCRRVEALKLT